MFSIKNGICENEHMKNVKFLLQKINNHQIFIILFIVMATVSIIGLSHCLPISCTADEKPAFIDMAVYMAEHAYTPLRYAHPAHFPGMILALILNLFQIDLNDQYMVFLLGRLISLTLFLGSLLLVYLISLKAFNKQAALFAAIFFSINPLIATYARIFRPEIWLVFLLLLSIYMYFRYLETQQKKFILLCGLVTGLAFTTKYTGILLAFPFSLHFIRLLTTRKLVIEDVVLFGSAIVSGIFIGSPYLFFNLHNVLDGISAEAKATHLGADQLDLSENIWWYATRYFNILGNFIFLLMLLGVWYSYQRSRSSDIKTTQHQTLIGMILFFTLMISILPLHWTRWILPILPLLVIYSGYGFDKLSRKFLLNRSKLAIVTLVLVISFVPALRTVLYITAKQSGDTRLQQQQWVTDNIPEATIRYEGYTGENPSGGSSLADQNLDFYKEKGYEYIATSSSFVERYQESPHEYSEALRFYEELSQEDLLVTFTPAKLNATFQRDDQNVSDIPFLIDFAKNYSDYFGLFGPEIKIYQLSDD